MARARPKLRGVADDDQPEVYSPAWVKMIHRQAKQELRQRQQVASFKPLPASGYAVQDINLFPDDDWIAISMSTAAGTVTLVMDRSQASALSGGLNRLNAVARLAMGDFEALQRIGVAGVLTDQRD